MREMQVLEIKNCEKSRRIMHFVECFDGGVFTVIKQISDYVSNNHKSHEQIIVFSIRSLPNSLEDELIHFKKEFPESVKFIYLPLSREIRPLSDFSGLLKFIKILNNERPDVVHCHSSKAGVIGRIAGLLFNKIKFLYTPHGYGFIREDIGNVKQKLFYMIEWCIGRISPSMTVACGDQEYEYAQRLTKKSTLVRNGVDVQQQQSFKKAKKNNRFTVISVGRITPAKNVNLFMQIAELLKNYPIDFVWVGDGCPELTKQMRLSANIKLMGRMSNQDALSAVSMAHVYLQTSLWEALSISVIEAMALGLPILATSIPANSSVVMHARNGYLFDKNDKSMAVKKILKLFNDKVLLTAFSEQSVAICSQLYDCQKNFESLLLEYS